MFNTLMTASRPRKRLLTISCMVILTLCLLTSDCSHWLWDHMEHNLSQLTKTRRNHSSGDCLARDMLTSFRHHEDVSKIDTCSRIFYNRVPKCASRTIQSIMRQLSIQNKFNFAFLTGPPSWHFSPKNASQMMNFTKQFSSIEEPFIYASHLFFFNFTQYGLPMPVYINVIRDPLERTMSHYYYNRFGSYSKPLQKNASFDAQGPMEECVDEKQCVRYFNVILPYFCGHSKFCTKYRSAADQWRLVSHAKQVIRQRYLVVGLTEDIPAFLEVLETYMPSFFKNATNVFNEIGGKMKAKYKTVKKVKLDEALERKLRHRLAADYDLYNFVKQKFYNQLKMVRTLKELQRFPNLFKDVIDGKPL